MLKKNIISLATVQAQLGKQFRITGLEQRESSELALLLRAGALAAPMYIVEERTIGPSLGADNIKLGVKSVTVGMAMVLLFMLVVYRGFGVFANIALAMNLVLLVAFMSLLGATLTLPGIAGIVLTVGMAVDANVLIFSRIREELAAGASIQGSISAGYDRAFVSILDANITTLIVAVDSVLNWFRSGARFCRDSVDRYFDLDVYLYCDDPRTGQSDCRWPQNQNPVDLGRRL